MIKSKHQFFERRQKVARELSLKGSHPYYVRMKIKLGEEEGRKAIKKLKYELDKRLGPSSRTSKNNGLG